MKKLAVILFITSVIFLGLGYHKLKVYESGEGYSESKNVYVGGDAYNYIINANYATGYFVLAMFSGLAGVGFIAVNKLEEIRQEQTQSIKELRDLKELKTSEQRYRQEA